MMKKSEMSCHLKFFVLVTIFFLTSGLLHAQNKDSVDFKRYWEFGGTFFGDYFYKINSDTIYTGTADYARFPKDFNAFSIRRALFGAKFNFTRNINATLAIEANDGLTASNGDRTFFIKLAFLEFKEIYKNARLVAGQQPTPTYSLTVEPVWGYRSIEKTITDMRGLGASTDLGVLLGGTFDDTKNFTYYAMIGNGTGTKAATNKGKKFYGTLTGLFAQKKLMFNLYSDYSFQPVDKSKLTLKAFLGFIDENFTAGAEVIWQNQYNFYKDTSNILPFGISVFARGQFVKNKLFWFARYDYFDNDSDFDENRTYSSVQYYFNENFITAGIDFTPVNEIHIMPNIWINTYSDKRSVNAIERKPDVVGRFTLAYFFK